MKGTLPRSFTPPILFALAVELDHTFGSRCLNTQLFKLVKLCMCLCMYTLRTVILEGNHFCKFAKLREFLLFFNNFSMEKKI